MQYIIHTKGVEPSRWRAPPVSASPVLYYVNDLTPFSTNQGPHAQKYVPSKEKQKQEHGYTCTTHHNISTVLYCAVHGKVLYFVALPKPTLLTHTSVQYRVGLFSIVSVCVCLCMPVTVLVLCVYLCLSVFICATLFVYVSVCLAVLYACLSLQRRRRARLSLQL